MIGSFIILLTAKLSYKLRLVDLPKKEKFIQSYCLYWWVCFKDIFILSILILDISDMMVLILKNLLVF